MAKGTKKIAYLIIDNGCDGRERDNIIYASWDETERDNALEKSPNKGYYRTDEKIVNEGHTRENALAKLNGIERLTLGLAQSM